MSRYLPGAATALRSLLSAFCVAIFFCGTASAAGLGEMEVMSRFNEPLQARIPVYLDSNDANVSSVQYGVATPMEFERMGLRWSYEISSLQFEYSSDDGKHYLLLKSKDRIREPLLSLVVYLQTIKGGRILRRYSVPMVVEQEQ